MQSQKLRDRKTQTQRKAGRNGHTHIHRGSHRERLEHREKEPDRQMDRETKPGRERQSVRFRERQI